MKPGETKGRQLTRPGPSNTCPWETPETWISFLRRVGLFRGPREAGSGGSFYRSAWTAGGLHRESTRAWHGDFCSHGIRCTVTQTTCLLRPEETTQNTVQVAPPETTPQQESIYPALRVTCTAGENAERGWRSRVRAHQHPRLPGGRVVACWPDSWLSQCPAAHFTPVVRETHKDRADQPSSTIPSPSPPS